MISAFEKVHVVTQGETPTENKFAEFDYCIPLCDEGVFIELGVWFGRSISYMAAWNPDKHFYGFDTFEGVDEVWETGGKTLDMKRFFVKDPDNINPDTGLPKVPDNVTLIKGMFQDTLEPFIETTLKDQKLAFINMDPDIYSATKYALETLNNNIKPGTIIRFDELSDWAHLGWNWGLGKPTYAPYSKWKEGEYKALVEWLWEFDREVEPLWRNWHQAAGVKVVK